MPKVFIRSIRTLAPALVLLVAVACKRPTPTKLEFHLGDPATAGPLTYNVVEAKWRNQLDAFPSARVPERNFLLVRVVITNSGGTEMGIPFLKVENSNGDVFTESENGAGVDNWLGLIRRISPAQTEDGWLLFDVPTNTYKLRVSDGAIENEHVAYISMPLSMQTDAEPAKVP